MRLLQRRPYFLDEPVDAFSIRPPVHGAQVEQLEGTRRRLGLKVRALRHGDSKSCHVDGSRKPPIAVAIGLLLGDGHDDVDVLQDVLLIPFQRLAQMPQCEPSQWVPAGFPTLLPDLVFVVVAAQGDQRVRGMLSDGIDVRRGVEALQVDHVVSPARQGFFEHHRIVMGVEPGDVVGVAVQKRDVGVAGIKARLDVDRFELGGIQIGVRKGVQANGVLPSGRSEHLHLCAIVQQPLGDGIHGQAPAIQGGKGRLVAKLEDAHSVGESYRLLRLLEKGRQVRSRAARHWSKAAAGTMTNVPSHIPQAGDNAPLRTIRSPMMVTT